MTAYKAHLFQSLGNGKINPSVSQCGRKLFSAHKGTHIVKTNEFISLYTDSSDNCCDKCAQYAKINGKIK
jgi:hypothetical protein